MSIPTRQHSVVTSHGSLAVEECGRGGMPVLMIHGNSSCRGVFRHQLQGRLAENHRLIAFDLPGHGRSSDAPDPMRSYTLPGLADAAIELLEKLDVREAIVFGWSLGGHVGIQMVSRFPGMRGLMITGTPPVARNGFAQGFKPSPHMAAAGKQDLSPAEIEAFVQAIFGDGAEPFLRDAMARTDGRFRKRVFEASREGAGVDQRQTVESSPVPLAVVNGSADPLVNLDYLDTPAYANLWEGRCHRLPGLGHAPFWQAPDDFNPILERFVRDVETGRAVAGSWVTNVT
ncbi:MAG: alpha/beta hydrolase fold family protein [Tardiphaga sp.]|jgi:pimeloyl-ACP methyl ester carboxylesterase|nr:alpha/beta hydrolase fold family protein [Tardiphaga sp.]